MDARGWRLGVTAFFGRLGDLFVADRLRELADLHALPCPVEADGEMRALRDLPEFLEFFAALRRRLLAGGAVEMRPHVCAIEVPRNGRFRVWLRWKRRFEDGRIEDIQDEAAVYYLAQGPRGRLLIEMMAFAEPPDGIESIEALGPATV